MDDPRVPVRPEPILKELFERIAELEGKNGRLRAGVELLASLGHTQHYTHPQASHRGWEHCSLAECVAASKVLAPKPDA